MRGPQADDYEVAPHPSLCSTPTAVVGGDIPVWPVDTDPSTSAPGAVHRHICPRCRAVRHCVDSWLGQSCRAATTFRHGVGCAGSSPATVGDLASLRANLAHAYGAEPPV